MKLFYLFIVPILLMASETHALAQSAQAPNRLLVVSGGGARGAWGVGVANRLDSLGNRYAHVVGTSTGSLMAPLILLRKFELLNRAYTSVNQKSIFNVNPFRKDGGIRTLNALFRFCKPSLGTTENLRTLIGEFVTPADYQQIRTSPGGLDFTVSVVNYRTREAAYRSASEHPVYEEMVNWMWASANQPVFMSPYMTTNKATGQTDIWFDGGVRNVIPIRQGLQIAYDKKYSAVDVIVNSTPNADEPDSDWPNGKANLLKMVIRTLDTYGSGTREMNITIGKLLDRLLRQQESMQTTAVESESAAEPAITLTFYFMPRALYNLIPNDLLFDPLTMQTLLDAGRNGQYAPTDAPFRPETTTLAIQESNYSFKLTRTAVRQLLDDLTP